MNEDRTQAISMAPHPDDNVAQVASTEARYSFASAVAGCLVHRNLHEAFEAQRAQDDATTSRMNRRLVRQLDLRFSRAARAVSA